MSLACCRTWCPTDLQHLCCKALINKYCKSVIQPSTSPWASPIVLVKKRDGTLRFCVDYCGLNSVTKSDQFPLPKINDMLD